MCNPCRARSVFWEGRRIAVQAVDPTALPIRSGAGLCAIVTQTRDPPPGDEYDHNRTVSRITNKSNCALLGLKDVLGSDTIPYTMRNTIYLKRKKKLYIEKEGDVLPDAYLVALQGNIQCLGFQLSPALLDIVKTFSVQRFKSFYKQLISDLKEIVGDNVIFKPMYPDFPEQVKEATELELYSNALFHYLGDAIGKRIMPHYEEKMREKLKDVVEPKVIDLGTKEEFNSIFTNLLRAKSSMSDSDRADAQWYIKSYGKGIYTYLPNEMPCKENAAYLLAHLILCELENEELLSRYAKTATDVLRLAVALSEGDISLAEATKFKNMSKKNRRILLQALERCGNMTEDMLRYKEPWKRLGERIHPFEFKKKYPRACAAFDIIRNDKPYETFNSKVEKSLREGNATSAAELLKVRPGELARRLDKLVRTVENATEIVDLFSQVADSVSSPVLLQVCSHFKARNDKKELRTFFPKGEVCKVKAIENRLPPINEHTCREITRICEQALIKRFSAKKQLGNVYIDERLRNFTVPFALRSASKALHTVSRGSRITLPPGNTIRFFIYWKDGNSRTDLDLSALALDADSTFKTTISYYNLKDMGGYHSGDITSAPNGASEFIDMDIDMFLQRGIRYVLMSINSFTNQPYCDLPCCFAGFMVRQHPNSGEIYDPVTVENRFDLTANSRIAIPLIVDLQERCVVWTDLSLKRNPSTNNNVHNNLSSLTIINKSMTTMIKPNLYDLFALHALARGKRVLTMSEADAIFALNHGIKPVDIEVIMAEFL